MIDNLISLKIHRSTIGRDLLAGATAAIAAIPDGMASAVLAGVNPVYGLYNLMIGTPVAAIFTSSVYMAVINTSAMALVVFESLSGFTGEAQVKALVTLTLLVGLFALVLGFLRLGYLTRFVSNSVMRGFLTGIAIVIILSQLPDFSGYAAQGANKVMQTIDLLLHIRKINLFAFAIGVLTIAIILFLGRIRLSSVSMLVALVFCALLVKWLDWGSVTLVGDTALIPRSFPMPVFPDLSLVLPLLPSAIAVGIIGLVQATGVSQGFPNPDGKFPKPDGDFKGQGLGNLAAGFFQGLPLGGSVSGTTLVVGAGARSRWANIFTGVFVTLGVLLFANQIQNLPMASLAGILILAGFQSIKPREISKVWKSTMLARFSMILTLVATLFLPVQEAIFLGVIIQIIIYIFQASERMTITELVPTGDGDFVERPAPATLPSNQVTVLLPTGSLFFAAAMDFEEELPSADKAHQAAVIIVLRGRQQLGSTAIGVLERYTIALQNNGGQLYLAGVSNPVRTQLVDTGAAGTIGVEHILPADERLIAPLNKAYNQAVGWLESSRGSSPT